MVFRVFITWKPREMVRVTECIKWPIARPVAGRIGACRGVNLTCVGDRGLVVVFARSGLRCDGLPCSLEKFEDDRSGWIILFELGQKEEMQVEVVDSYFSQEWVR
jgi:hypothetical protein